MLERVRQTIQKFQLITTGQTLVVGVSGGTDSLALLHILNQLGRSIGFTIHAATLDHQLRGEESAGDVRFVEQICREWGIAVTTGQADVSRLARQQQIGIETAARLARYDFLAATAYRVGASNVAVAHHVDDQAETVLMHILRGAGIHGLAGMAMRSTVPNHDDLLLIRPLLEVTRAEIEEYCQQNYLIPRVDSTNVDTSILRNAIRLEVLPFLEGYAPQTRPALARLAEIAAIENDYIQQQINSFTRLATLTISAGRIAINRDAFNGLHPALQRRVLLWGMGKLGLVDHASAHLIMEAIEIAKRGRHGAIALLGGGGSLRVDYLMLFIETEDSRYKYIRSPIPLLPANFTRAITIPSLNTVQEWLLQVRLEQPPNDKSYCKLEIPNGSQAILRTRHDGDVFSPLGMNGHTQKVSRWMVNRKIPREIRDQIPLLVVNDMIAAIVVNDEWFVSELFAVRNSESPIIYFQFLENS
ncbi:MAG: tRNA lysidine(34) synthetase TilS [Anaerolineaceae bacterium]|nr:tRNA lysidine(34) synthetase TilS [Anaerolineaceae bacterium]